MLTGLMKWNDFTQQKIYTGITSRESNKVCQETITLTASMSTTRYTYAEIMVQKSYQLKNFNNNV